MPTERAHSGWAPSRAVSIALSSALVVLWATIRLVMFDETVFPLTYVLPMLVCVWTRDRVALWAMAGAFAILHTLKFVWILPDVALTNANWWAGYTATVLNIAIGAAVVHAVIQLRDRLEGTLQHVRAQAEELRAQGEELAQQNEELAEQAEELSRQTEELAHQGEELASQNEELQSQTEEIAAMNEALERRERLLQALLDTARLSSTERAALQHIAGAALDLLEEDCAAAAVYEKSADGLRIRALTARAATKAPEDLPAPEDGFVGLVLHENRTACLNDAALRPDLPLAEFADQPAYRAVLCAPIHLGPEAFGAFAVYAARSHEWTDEEFRIAEWLADQCGRVLQALRVQSELREADQRKSEFLATLSHELRNPLAPIGFALKAIESGNGDSAHAMRIMRRQYQQLVRLVDDLLDATRLSSNKVQIRRVRTDLVSVVQQAVEAARPDMEAADLAVTVDLPPDPIWVHADPDRLAQVVANLLNNATRYTPAAGRVAVAVSAPNGEAVLSVSDTGIGLAKEDLDRVFEMFTQVGGPGSGGLGIGLSLVRGIVDLHGGRVQAFSDGPGRGAEFRVTLPVAPDATQVDAKSVDAAPSARRSCRVLIVDDNTDSAEMMGALLEANGHTVCLAHDAASALAASFEFLPEVALLDIGLPDADGYDLAQRFRQDERTRGVHLIALTGWGQEHDRARARAAGFDTHLTKPADPDRVLAAVSSAAPA